MSAGDAGAGFVQPPVLTPPPLSLYLHTPWCLRKCPYCDFNSHQASGEPDFSGYVDALLADLELEVPLVEGRAVETIFIGGGTPSLFSDVAIARLMTGVKERLQCHATMEVTLEANPGACEAARFAGYLEAGVNRLSIGVQSFSADSLVRLGRIHSPDDAVDALSVARGAGFDNINIDLMFGLPAQTPDQAMQDVATGIRLEPEHISYYQLTLEPNTRFATRPPALPSDGRIWEMQAEGHAALTAAGYGQYEVSAFAAAGRQCRHNLNYWGFGDYLGIGAGAHGKITDHSRNRIQRRWRVRGPDLYMQSAGSAGALAGSRYLSPADRTLEFMMNLLRLNDGFSASLYRARTGLEHRQIEPLLELAQSRGLITTQGGRALATPLGRRFLNDLLAMFVDDDKLTER